MKGKTLLPFLRWVDQMQGRAPSEVTCSSCWCERCWWQFAEQRASGCSARSVGRWTPPIHQPTREAPRVAASSSVLPSVFELPFQCVPAVCARGARRPSVAAEYPECGAPTEPASPSEEGCARAARRMEAPADLGPSPSRDSAVRRLRRPDRGRGCRHGAGSPGRDSDWGGGR